MITKKDVEYVAALSRLEFSEDEKEKYTEQLNVILEYINQLNELDTEGVKPTYHVMPVINVLREDEVRQSIDRDDVLMNAPTTQDGCFKVPRIIE
ncbi:MAG TPA: Asp-tRNA(Asn)/Glu-tRNA(Gln) amidotransferase subunit GatC [Clostridia bacterium]|nr:Asp-tRNA(Asn)/Glu-tRNA(Gln) amidotransferase subunit GatC [Clostridia bacterium]